MGSPVWTQVVRTGRGVLRMLAVPTLACLAGPTPAAESGQFWPELDAYVTLGERTRLFLLASGSVFDPPGSGGSTQFQDMQLGVHLDVTLLPPLRSTLAKADWVRHRYLWARVGYRYGRSLGDTEQADRYREHRGIFELTGRTPPLAAGLELIGRVRWDARDVNDHTSSRYRLRLQVEKSLDWDGRAVVPFVNVESFYDTRFDSWTRRRYQVGAEVQFDHSWRIEPSLTWQHDTRGEPAHVKALGLTLKYYY